MFVCVALSGGVDSTALLAALAAVRPKRLTLRAVHVNHGLHPDSVRWSEHCRSLAQSLAVPITILAAKVPRGRGISLEAAARDSRYALLARELAAGEFLLSAHHEDDQLETVLLQLFRGAGLAGLAAMPEVAPFSAGWLVRPLLSRSRQELEAWVRKSGLPWVEDETNADESLDRNYLRRRVLPLIRERWQGVGSAVCRSARHAAEGQRLLDGLARADVERASWGAELSVKTLRALQSDRRRNALRFWIGRTGLPMPDTRRLDQLAGPMIDARPDANPVVAWGATVVQRHTDLLSIRARVATDSPRVRADVRSERKISSATDVPQSIPWSWRACPKLDLPGACGKLELKPDRHGPIALDILPETVLVRWRQGGERLRPRRGGPRRALKSLLQEAHLALGERASLPLIYSGDRLLAAGSLWLDESIQAGPATRHRGRLFWTPAPPM